MPRPRPPSPSPSPTPRSRPGPATPSGSAARATSHRSSRAASPSRPPSRSQSPSPSRPPSRPKGNSSSSSSRHNRSLSRHTSRHSSHRGPSQQEKKHSSRGKLIKDSAGLLLGIGVAVIVAHRLWPKEVPYGGKEKWDTKTAARVRRHDQGDCCRRERPPRRRERGRSRNRPCYESERPPPPEPVPEPPRWRSRSSRRDPRGRSLEPDPRRVYEDVVDTTRWATHAPDRQQVWTRDAREPSYVSQRCYYQRGGDAGHHLHRNDDIFVVERAVPRYGDRGYR